MATTLERRLAKELSGLEDTANYEVRPGIPGDIFHLDVALRVPSGTPYSGGIYRIYIQIPSSYPFARPVMKFDTKIWHPNIHPETVWTHGLCITKILLAVVKLTTIG